MSLIRPHHTFIGVDPGKSGGIAILRSYKPTVEKYHMPATEADLLDTLDVITSVEDALVDETVMAVVELISPSIYGTSKSSNAKLYGNYMSIRMALTALRIPFTAVTAQKWHKSLGIPPRKKTETQTQWKNRLKAKAQQLFPQETVTLATADALLIACYCKKVGIHS
ncbi:MAG: hypothetical protein WC455_11185 [Dehalococcoidia bacterium]|jgi:hypothetical protein